MQQQTTMLLPAAPVRQPSLFRPSSSSLVAPTTVRVTVRYMSERSGRRETLLDNLSSPDGTAHPTSAQAAPSSHSYSSPDSMQQQAPGSRVPHNHASGQAFAGEQPVSQQHAAGNSNGTSHAGPQRGMQQPPYDSNGWGDSATYTSSSSDDGGWGEGPSMQDWGDAYTHPHHAPPQQAYDPAAPSYPPQQHGGAHEVNSNGAWDAGPPPLDYNGWGWQGSPGAGFHAAGPHSTRNNGAADFNSSAAHGQPGYDQPHQHPHLDDNVPMGDAAAGPGPAGGPAYEWQFFADGTRPGAGPQQQWGPEGPLGPDGQPAAPQQPSDVTLLSRTEMDAVLPMTPTGRQADYFRPHTVSERVVQLVGSLAASMLLSKSTVLAAPALLYPLWSPWIRAALKNVEVYGNQLETVGLWRAQVLDVQVLANNTFRPGWSGGSRGLGLGQRPPSASGAVVRLLMGDPWEGGARVQLEFPYQPKAELLRPGEAVEALVLAKDTQFYAFKVIREVYAPGLGLWLAEYPFVDRTAFLDVSLQIERSRQSESEAAWGGAAPADAAPHTYVVDVDITEPTQSWDYSPPDTGDAAHTFTGGAAATASSGNGNVNGNSSSNGAAGFGSNGNGSSASPFTAAEAVFSGWGAQAAAGFAGYGSGLGTSSQAVQEQLGAAVGSMDATLQGASSTWGSNMGQAWDTATAAASAAAAAATSASSALQADAARFAQDGWNLSSTITHGSPAAPYSSVPQPGAWPDGPTAARSTDANLPTGWDDVDASGAHSRAGAAGGDVQQRASGAHGDVDAGWASQQQKPAPQQAAATRR